MQRRWFQKKIQEMQRKCEAQVRAAKRGSSSDDTQALQKRIRSQDKEIERLREELMSMPAGACHLLQRRCLSLILARAVQAAALLKAKELHERQLLAQAEEHQATVARLRMELLAASKSLAAARSEVHDAKTVSKSSDPSLVKQQDEDKKTDSRLQQDLAVANGQVS